MITPTIDSGHFAERAQQIKGQIPTLLTQWGLLPNFNRWRLAQDPETGMVVLFGVLNSRYITTHSATPLDRYFDPRLLRNLEKELQVRILPSTGDGLRYTFLLDAGKIGLLPGYQEIFENQAEYQAAPKDDVLHQRISRLLKMAEDIETLSNTTETPTPDTVDEAKFNQQMADYEANPDHNASKKETHHE